MAVRIEPRFEFVTGSGRTKFERSCEIQVADIVIPPGSLDLFFRIRRTAKMEPNTCEVGVYNLNPDNRSLLEALNGQAFADATGERIEDVPAIPCVIQAGYVDNVAQIWSGDLRTAYSVREGPDWLTVIESGDGEKNCRDRKSARSFGKDTSISTVLRALAEDLGLGEGNLADVVSRMRFISGSSVFPEGVTLHGPAAYELENILVGIGWRVSVQNGVLQFQELGKPLSQDVAIVVNEDTGMVDSPSVDSEGILQVRSLLNPDLRPGALVIVEAQRVNGSYVVEEADYSGDTSGADWFVDLRARRL